MNDEQAVPRSGRPAPETDREVGEELQALLAELERRLEAKESHWRRAGLIPARVVDESTARSRPAY